MTSTSNFLSRNALHASVVYATEYMEFYMSVRLSVCLSHSWSVSKRLNGSSWILEWKLPQACATFCFKGVRFPKNKEYLLPRASNCVQHCGTTNGAACHLVHGQRPCWGWCGSTWVPENFGNVMCQIMHSGEFVCDKIIGSQNGLLSLLSTMPLCNALHHQYRPKTRRAVRYVCVKER